MRNGNGDKSDLEAFLKARTQTPLGAVMSLALACLVLSLAMDVYSDTRGLSRFFAVLATVLSLDLVPVAVAAVERWRSDGRN